MEPLFRPVNLFSWLLLGHLVGDWLLQNDWMAKGKKRALLTRAGLVHFLVYAGVMLAALGLTGGRAYSPLIYAASGVIFFVSHWLIDATTLVERWIRFYGQTNTMLMRVMVDQVLHLLVVAVVAFLWQS